MSGQTQQGQGLTQDQGTPPQPLISPTEPQQQGDPSLNNGVVQPPTPPVTPVLDPNVARLIQESIRSQAERADRAERELRELQNRRPEPPAPPPLTPEQQSELFLSRPIDTVREVVDRQINASIAPINEMMQRFVVQQQREAAIANAKAQMRANPTAFPYLTHIEREFDTAIANVANVDNNTIVMIYNALVGQAFNSGVLRSQQPTQPQNVPTQQFSPSQGNPQQPTNNMMPAHLRPQPNSPPTAQNNNQPLSITEEERALARFYKMNDADYVALRDNRNFVVKPTTGANNG